MADLRRIRAWYKRELGPAAAARAVRSIRMAIASLERGVDVGAAVRPDLPLGVYRVIARRHLVLFDLEGDVARVLRIVDGARDLPSALDE